jgi:hypothetical protein
MKMPRLASLTLAVVLATVPAAALVPGECAKGVNAARELASSFYRTELYFGRSIPGGGVVAAEDWQRFLAEVVTPRFPDGFTIVSAAVQYRGRDNSIVKEQSDLLIFLYPISKRVSSSRKIEEIRRSYKKRFNQESVLRVDVAGTVRVSF